MKVPETHELYEFGAFRMDFRKRRLYRNGEEISLTPKEFELLFVLVENAGRIVEKDDLHEKIWQDTFVEDGTLTRNISWLRKKLGDGSGGGEKFIETMPKRGYRFLPEVTKSFSPNTLVVEEQTRTHIRIEETLTIPQGIPTNYGYIEKQLSAPSRRRIPAVFVLTLGIVALAAIGLSVYQVYFRRSVTTNTVATRIVPFSGSLGREDGPAFTPDGKQLAYAWNGGEADNLDIYVRLINAGEPIRLTNTEFTERHPTFSPDGLHIAFVRSLKTHGEVIIIPALGGAERRVASLFSGFASVSFSPDGETLAVIDTDDSTEGKPYAVHLINLVTGERKRLNPPGEYTGETTPRFAPDGKSLAFVRVFPDRSQDIFIAPTIGGEPRRITFDGKVIHSLSWGSGGTDIFFVSLRGNNQTSVWCVAATGGEPDLIATAGNKEITNLAVSRDGKTVAFVENTINLDVWQIGKNQPERKLIGSTYSESSPQLSPDASRVAFVSNRSGKNEIWLSDAAGKNLRQLTNSEANVAAPDFSPDGA